MAKRHASVSKTPVWPPENKMPSLRTETLKLSDKLRKKVCECGLCCPFFSEILKCILYQRQQLLMTYDQLFYSQKKQQASTQVKKKSNPAGTDSRKCQQTLQELEEVLQQLEVLFALSRVPRVLLLMGGSLILPKELYEINMEGLVLAGGEQCLRVSSCFRQIFHTLFVADLLSNAKPVCSMPTTVLALAHRDCGVGWFRPKLHQLVKNQMIALSTNPSACKGPRAERSDREEDCIWFQALMTEHQRLQQLTKEVGHLMF
uniref:MAD2L1 binding protein n=1 Tax=Salarias fasciatus TaxID=181472 RepID=A0A672JFJ5_SALFA